MWYEQSLWDQPQQTTDVLPSGDSDPSYLHVQPTTMLYTTPSSDTKPSQPPNRTVSPELTTQSPIQWQASPMGPSSSQVNQSGINQPEPESPRPQHTEVAEQPEQPPQAAQEETEVSKFSGSLTCKTCFSYCDMKNVFLVLCYIYISNFSLGLINNKATFPFVCVCVCICIIWRQAWRYKVFPSIHICMRHVFGLLLWAIQMDDAYISWPGLWHHAATDK